MSLRDRSVVVTRDEPADGPLSTALTRRGARPILRSTMTFRFEGPGSELEREAAAIGKYDWLVLTSARTVRALVGVRLFERGQPSDLRIAAVGPGTAEAVAGQGWSVAIAPESGGGAALAEEMSRLAQIGGRVLLPASQAASDEVQNHLTGLGCEVHRVVAYAPVARNQDERVWAADLDARALDAVTFTSPSAVRSLQGALPGPLFDRLRDLPAGAQGPTTAGALRDSGFTTVVEADLTTFEGLADELDRWFGARE